MSTGERSPEVEVEVEVKVGPGKTSRLAVIRHPGWSWTAVLAALVATPPVASAAGPAVAARQAAAPRSARPLEAEPMDALPTCGLVLRRTVSMGPLPARPKLSGEERTLDTADGRFKVHYTLSGADAVLPPDDLAPANGVPDAVDTVAEALVGTAKLFIDDDGWLAPAGDGTIGGDSRLDVYVRSIDARGYAHAQVVAGVTQSYLELNPRNYLVEPKVAASVAAHELHHALQFAYTLGPPTFLQEGTSTYIQYLLYDSDILTLARDALWSLRLNNPEQSIAYEDGSYEYSAMVFIKFVADWPTRDPDRLRRLWLALADDDGWASAVDSFFRAEQVAGGFAQALAEHALWNYFACGNDDGRHYDPSTAGCTLEQARVVSTQHSTYPLPEQQSGQVQPSGAFYLELARDCQSRDLEVRIAPPAGGRASFGLLGLPGDGSQAELLQQVLETEAAQTYAVPGWNRFARLVAVAQLSSGLVPDLSFRYQATPAGTYVAPGDRPRPLSVSLAPAEPLSLRVGEWRQLAASATYGTCEDGEDVTTRATWSSTAAAVQVESGRVQAETVGIARVTAVLDGVTSQPVEVTVLPAADGGTADGRRADSGSHRDAGGAERSAKDGADGERGSDPGTGCSCRVSREDRPVTGSASGAFLVGFLVGLLAWRSRQRAHRLAGRRMGGGTGSPPAQC